MDKGVVVFAAGGTIAMKYDEKLNGLTPALTGRELVEAVPGLEGVCPVEVREFSLEPSSRITPAVMMRLARYIDEALSDRNVCGAVVTHGTDTLEETAYFLDLYIDSEKPVCVTGAMRSGADVSPDGARNILDAVRTAASPDARNMGTLVVMNEEIHAAGYAVKTHSANPKTFASPFWGPLGYADADRVIFNRKPFSRTNIRPDKAEADVPLIKLYTGMDNAVLDFLLDKGADGLVIEAFGRGNMSDVHVPAVKRFIDKGLPVVLCTRAHGGRVLGSYAYDGGGKRLIDMGVISADSLPAAKARLKLILALGITEDVSKIAAYFN